ncbi:MAG: hypothetical protein WDM89_14595 [Rhizomicrobium sp.]
MKISVVAGTMLAISAVVLPASAADDAALTRMTLCQDSWLDWSKSAPKTFDSFRSHFMGEFSPHDNDPYMLPKANVFVLGMHVAQGFPSSVGMGVGFSLTVDAPFDKARSAMETALGKKLLKCEASDGMKSCELEIAPQRTITLMAEDSAKSGQTLIGCYYFYEK